MDKAVLEIGAGTGLLSIVASLLGMFMKDDEVYFTSYELMKHILYTQVYCWNV